MSSERRIAASRANGKKSKGPVTPEGKARSAANTPRTHGLSTAIPPPATPGTTVCLTNENQDEFNALFESLVGEHAPATTTEHLTVHEMAVTRWRLQRAWMMEAALLDYQMDDMVESLEQDFESTDEATRSALAFRDLADKSHGLSLLRRYEARLTRQLDRCLRRLADLRAAAHEKVNLQVELNPENEQHDDNSNSQLPLESSAGTRAEPPPPTQSQLRDECEHAVAPPPSTPAVVEFRESRGRQASDPESAPAPDLPRAA